DAFIGGQSGQIAYFENQDPSVGAAKTMPTFVLSTDSAPFGLSDIGFDVVPTFVDIDFDGDFDAFVGEYSGTIRYFENRDSSVGAAKTMPDFVLSANTQPFGLSNVGFRTAPTIVDIDGDNFFEAIAGNFEGQLIYFESDIVLPVELVFFKAKAQKDQVLLQWQTASELDNQGFYIERSQDAKTWESLGFVKGAGTTTASQSYSFTDKAPIAGDNYYRLKQIDFDSGFEYSAIEVVQLLNQAVALNIFPIPTKEILYYRTDQMGKITSVQLHDLLGRLVLNTTTFDGELDLSMLPKGQYVLTIEGLGASIHRIVQKQ
ncbi:MAG: T9SS type A sorting domain-containing protein, partial [Bacteroidota bacterium]